MAPQDYISRSNSKKKSPYKKKPEVQSVSIKVKIVALITALGIAAGGYGLWHLTSVKPLETSPAIKQSAPVKQQGLPKPPTEKWDYIDKLKEDKNVEVGQYEMEQKGPYKMACASFRKQTQAEALKAKIAFAGLTAKVSASNGANGQWYRVTLGPYATKRLAEKDKHKLKRSKLPVCQILLIK